MRELGLEPTDPTCNDKTLQQSIALNREIEAEKPPLNLAELAHQLSRLSDEDKSALIAILAGRDEVRSWIR